MTAGSTSTVPDAEVRCALDVVAIGASAGGVTALPIVLSTLPRTFPAAVLVVMHLDPRSPSLLASVLARQIAMPVRQAEGGDILERGTVYVAPPGVHLVVRDGTLVLTHETPVHFARPSVDVLFTSVAAACGSHAVAVVLTGGGVDGAAGLRTIKRHGGRTIVQDPLTAEHAGMPKAATATGCADLTLPLAEIGPALAGLLRVSPPAVTDGPAGG